jgi:hypothetical protein
VVGLMDLDTLGSASMLNGAVLFSGTRITRSPISQLIGDWRDELPWECFAVERCLSSSSFFFFLDGASPVVPSTTSWVIGSMDSPGSASTLSSAVFLSGPSATRLPIGPFVGDGINGLPQLHASLSVTFPIGKGKQPYFRGSTSDPENQLIRY